MNPAGISERGVRVGGARLHSIMSGWRLAGDPSWSTEDPVAFAA